jgi:hypothetical protein
MSKHSQDASLPDDDVVDTFAEWCEAKRISPATGRRLLTSGQGPNFIRLSPRRIGIRRKDDRAWLKARTECGGAAA